MKYDIQKRDKAVKGVSLRGLVAVYIGWLGIKLATEKDTAMAPALAWTLAGLFIAAGIGTAVYSVCRFRSDMAEARLTGAAPESAAEDK